MTGVPRPPLVLGLAGLLPFFYGAATILIPAVAELGMSLLGPRFVGPYVLIFYGTIILSFMSGVLWGFATKAEGAEAARGYALSVLPALWAFFFVGGGEERALYVLGTGFLGLLALDRIFWRSGLAPEWWMQLRLVLTAGVLLCLAVGILA